MKKYYVEVVLKENANVISETLSRIGIVSENIITQSCHLFSDKDKHYIVHFKELFSSFSFKNTGSIEESKVHMQPEDFHRRNSIIFLMNNWNLITIPEKEYILEHKGDVKLSVIPFKDKGKYILRTKFKINRN